MDPNTVTPALLNHIEQLWESGANPENPTKFTDDQLNNLHITKSEIKRTIDDLETKKAHSGLSNFVLKHSGPGLVKFLFWLLNIFHSLDYWPLHWRTASIFPLPKGGNRNRTDPTSYRGISLLDGIAKILDKILSNRLQTFLDRHKVLRDDQMGGRKALGATLQLIRITEGINKIRNTGDRTVLALLDVSKAFDKLNRPKLIQKLHRIGINGHLLNNIAAFLTERVHTTSIQNSTSESSTPKQGSPQGSSLSMHLFWCTLTTVSLSKIP